jgi:hypothetical protein
LQEACDGDGDGRYRMVLRGRATCPFISNIVPRPCFNLAQVDIHDPGQLPKPRSYPVACPRQSRTRVDKFYTNENALSGELEHGLCPSTAVGINSLTMLPWPRERCWTQPYPGYQWSLVELAQLTTYLPCSGSGMHAARLAVPRPDIASAWGSESGGGRTWT